jgi:hypothetical protein
MSFSFKSSDMTQYAHRSLPFDYKIISPVASVNRPDRPAGRAVALRSGKTILKPRASDPDGDQKTALNSFTFIVACRDFCPARMTAVEKQATNGRAEAR